MNWELVSDILPGVAILSAIVWAYMTVLLFWASDSRKGFDLVMSMVTAAVLVVVVAAINLIATAMIGGTP